MENTGQNGTVTEAQLAFYAKCRQDPWFFLAECVFTQDQVDQDDPIKPFPAHLDYLKLFTQIFTRRKLIAVPKSRRMTMSWTCISLILWDVIFHKGKMWAFVSMKEEHSAELVSRAKFIYDHIPRTKIPDALLPKLEGGKMLKSPPQLNFPEINSKLQGFPMGADQLRQFTFSGILGDECAFWPEAQKFYSAAKPTIDGGGTMILVSSRAPGFFKKIVFDQIDRADYAFPEVPAGPLKHPMQGVEISENPKNKFLIFDLHYTANPAKRSAEFREAVRSSMPVREFLMEYEKNWDTFEGMPVFPDFRKDIHIAQFREEPHLGLPLLCGLDFGLCYDDQTEVMTSEGWKFFHEIDIKKDKVAVLNPTTFKVSYEEPSAKIDKPYEGDLYYCEGQNLNFAVTPNHIIPHWTEAGMFERIQAKVLLERPGHRRVRLTGLHEEGESSSRYGLAPKLYAAFMGAFLSEGHIDENRIAITQTKKHEWLSEILNATEWDWRRGSISYRCYNAAIATDLKTYGLQHNRYIPRDILNGTREMQLAFLNAYTNGDGHIRTRENGSEEHTIFTCSSQMADDFQELAFKLGWNSSIRKIGPTESYFQQENRTIKSEGGYSITFKKRTDWAELRAYEHEKHFYRGRVYCLTVSTGILYVRRNGRPHWNGNSPALVVAQLRGSRLIVLREYTDMNRGIKQFLESTLPKLQQEFPEWDVRSQKDYHFFIDPAGFQKNQVDARSCVQQMNELSLRNITPGPLDWESRRSSVEQFLLHVDREGYGLSLNRAECPTLIEAFQGGYRYPDSAGEIEPQKIRPIKDRFSHVSDALQYLCGGVRRKRLVKSPEIKTPYYGFVTNTETHEKQGDDNAKKRKLGGIIY